MAFYTLLAKIMNENMKKLGISLVELQKMQKLVDDTYYNLIDLRLDASDIYYKLQNLHGWLDDLLEDEHLDEDALDEIWCFYENHYKN